ncbi:nodulation protein NfeD [Nitriliruptoraceae bacterium ZYF776]|nr:nodulation protein NfeD [Profundirhabdus halotolerans]
MRTRATSDTPFHPRRVRRGAHRSAVVLAALVAGLVGSLTTATAQDAGPTVGLTDVTGVITPVTADHLTDTLAEAAEAGHEALVVRLDTPGGLVDSTRVIVREFLDAPLPVLVHVAPQGADAGSAGTFITYAAHVAAMAPTSTIGAATPVGGEGEDLDAKVIENIAAFAQSIAEARDRDVDFAIAAVREGRSITATDALEVGAIDLIAGNLDELLTAVDGTQVEVRDETVTLATDGATVVELQPGVARQILGFLADPNLAFIFLSFGTLAILYEIANPGLGLGGVVGVTAIVLAMFSLAVLPVNAAGVVLLVVAAAMFIAELFIPGIGVGAAGGTAALVLGGLFLFPSDAGIGIDLAVLIPVVVVVAALTIVAGRLVARAHRRATVGPSDYLVGRTITVEHASEGRPRAKVDGTWWRLAPAEGAGPLRDGDQVEVVDRDNLDLVVAPPTAATDGPTEAGTAHTD